MQTLQTLKECLQQRAESFNTHGTAVYQAVAMSVEPRPPSLDQEIGHVTSKAQIVRPEINSNISSPLCPIAAAQKLQII